MSTLLDLIRDDAFACTFQSLGQYRSALINAALSSPIDKGPKPHFDHLAVHLGEGSAPRVKDCTPVFAEDDGWSEWQFPLMRGYRMQCCDCGLVHEVDFQAVIRTNDLPSGAWENDSLDLDKYRVAMRMKRED